MAPQPTHFEELIATVEDYAIFTLDSQGRILDWNLGAERIKQYKSLEIIGQHFSRFYLPEDIEAGIPQKSLEIAATAGCHVAEGWRLRKDGSRFWANVTITTIRRNGQVQGFLKITRDLTERKEVMESLRQSEERFRLLVESAIDCAIIMLNPDGVVASWNAGASRIKLYTASEIIGRHFSVFYPPESISKDLPNLLLSRALKDGYTEHEGWRVRKDGTQFWAHVSITALRDSEGNLRGFAKITRDLTESKEAEELKETNRQKDTFLATLAHELRNPLAPMLPGLEMILTHPEKTEQVKSIASTLKQQVDQMSRLIEDLLDMSRISTGKIVLRKTPSKLADVLKNAIESAKPTIAKAGHHLTVNLNEESLQVEIDRHRVSQMVTNLLSNAAKYTPPGGFITLTAEIQSDSILQIKVSDNGNGISHDLQDRIFELFDQGAHGSDDGLGIGLTLVKTLAEMHGGTVSVYSDGLGKGSTFTLRLPVRITSESGKEPQTLKPPASSHRHSFRVLIADDGKNAADVLALFFTLEGVATATAYDGIEAVEKAATFRPHLILMDLGMPRLDGFAAARQIREKHPDIVLIALSGWGSTEHRRLSAEAGFDLHLVKPVNPDDLRNVIEQYLTSTASEE